MNRDVVATKASVITPESSAAGVSFLSLSELGWVGRAFVHTSDLNVPCSLCSSVTLAKVLSLARGEFQTGAELKVSKLLLG